MVVDSFAELLAVPLRGECNAVCWRRELAGDYGEVVRAVVGQDLVVTLGDELLSALPLSQAGRVAAAMLRSDQELLRGVGQDPVVDCIRGYERDAADEIVATDVYSFHVDRATQATDTFLCSYTAPASQGLCNEDAVRRVDIPAVRAELLRQFGGDDAAGFADWLAEHCFDLHYAPLPGARTFDFGVGNLWRIAVDYPGCMTPACIHRAPETGGHDPARLLLIS